MCYDVWLIGDIAGTASICDVGILVIECGYSAFGKVCFKWLPL